MRSPGVIKQQCLCAGLRCFLDQEDKRTGNAHSHPPVDGLSSDQTAWARQRRTMNMSTRSNFPNDRITFEPLDSHVAGDNFLTELEPL